MPEFELLRDTITRRATELSEKAVAKYRQAILPIYGSTENGVPDHIGTCIALEVNSQKVLLTAAHVIDQNENTSLYVGVGSLMPLEMEFFSSAKQSDDRSDDYYDFAVGQLPNDTIAALDGVSFISASDLDIEDSEPDGTVFTLVGYPNSKNKKVDRIKKKPLVHFSNIGTPAL